MKYYRYYVGRLPFRSGRVIISCAACWSEPMIVFPESVVGEFYFIDKESNSCSAFEISPGIKAGDIAAIEIRFCDQLHEPGCIKLVGCVGVDSAQIIVADEQDLEESVSDPLFITEESGIEITKQLIDTFELKTRRLADGWTEVIANDREEVYRQLSQHIVSLKLGNPEALLRFNEEFTVYDRIFWGEDDGPIISLGKSSFFNVSPNGSDGQYDVYAEFDHERLLRCWVLISDELFSNGRPKADIEDIQAVTPKH